MWYDRSLLLSHNKLFNFVLGNRGGGKSFDFKFWSISDFKKTGAQFIWVRRYKSELKTMGSFFDDIIVKFPDDEFQLKGDKFQIKSKEDKWLTMGYLIPLSTSAQKKSIPFPLVNKIIFDEFLIDKGMFHYLKNEVEVFLDLFETVARLRDNVRAVFVANAISSVNPYFLYWKLKPNPKKRFSSNEHIIIEFFKDQDFIDAKNQTRFGKVVMGTKYGEFSVENAFLRENEIFIGKKTPEAEFMMAIKYQGQTHGYWVDYKEGYIYVNNQFDPSSYSIYALTKADHEPNMLLIKSLAQCKPLEKVIYCFNNGLLKFHDQQIKATFFDYIAYFLSLIHI